MERIKLLIICLLFVVLAQAEDYIRIGDVRFSWRTENGSIKNAFINIEPKGLYAQCNMILDFTTEGTSFLAGDSLEIQIQFSMPEGTEITNLWLWINNEPVVAKIYDKWTASLIYESIVKRRIDPCILSKVGTNTYSMKIFPLMTDMPRRLEISYLTPINDLSKENSTIPLPISLLKLSKNDIDSIQVNFKKNFSFINPRIDEVDEKYVHVLETSSDNLYKVHIMDVSSISSLNLTLSNSSSENYFFGMYNDSSKSEKYYQLEINPSKILNVPNTKKALFLIDFIDENCSVLEKSSLLSELKNTIINTFNASDSLNIMFSGMLTASLNDNWLKGDSQTICSYFNKIDENIFNSYSNLPTLLVDGINFIKNNGNTGSIILIASSTSHGDNIQANSLIEDYLTSIGNSEIPIYIIDLDDNDYNYWDQHYIGGNYYYGNEYLYIHLSQKTVGEYYSIRDHSFYYMLDNTISKTSGYFSSLELITKMNNGFTYSNYKFKANSETAFYDHTIKQVGKLAGNNLPLEISVYGQQSNGELVIADIIIDGSDVYELDSVTKTIWASQYINEMYSLEQSNFVINKIIKTSIDERVLSNYTAFLVLEPGFNPDIEKNPDDGEVAVNIDSRENDKSLYSISNFPNPFSTSTTFQYTLPYKSEIKIIVYNMQGQVVTELIHKTLDAGTYFTEFNTDKIQEGIYYYLLIANNEIIVKNKMVKLK